MSVPVSFVTVFYDKAHPKTSYYAMYKRVNERQWTNLTDGISGKEVELRQNDDAPIVKYKILEHRTFQIFNSVENVMYAIFDIEKVKKQSSIFSPTGNEKHH
jgi:hypothetical protein